MKYPYAQDSATAHDRAVAELGGGTQSERAPGPVILRADQPYDLTTPGTPQGIIAVARAAEQGATLPPPGGWSHRATFALAQTPDGAEVIASLCLRLVGDLPGRPRRAWVAYVRDEAGGWRPNGAALLDSAAERPMRVIGIEELKATLRGEVWMPPVKAPPSPALTVPCPTCGRPARLTGAGKIYASHKCTTSGTTEGRS